MEVILKRGLLKITKIYFLAFWLSVPKLSIAYGINNESEIDSLLLETLDSLVWESLQGTYKKEDLKITEGLIDSLQHYCEKYNYAACIGNTNYYRALFYKYQGDLDSAIFYLNRAVLYFKQQEDTLFLGPVYNQFSAIYTTQGKWDKALIYTQKTIRIRKREELDENNKFGITKNICQKGTIYKNKGDLPKALESYIEALHFAQKNKCGPCILEVYASMALFYQGIKNCDKSLYYIHLIENSDIELQSFQKTYTNEIIGLVYFKCQGNYEKAKSFFEQALNLYREKPFKDLAYESLLDLATIYTEMKMLDSAKVVLSELISGADTLSDTHEIKHKAYTLLGTIELDQGNHRRAKEIFMKVLSKYRENLDFEYLSKIYQKLTLIHKNQGDLTKAFFYQELFYQYRDSAFNESRLQQLKDLEIKYSTEEKQAQINLLKRESEFKTAKIVNERRQKGFFLVLFIFICFIAYLLFRRFKNKRDFAAQRERMNFVQEKLRAEKHLIETEQKLLLAQLNPHFISNALASIDAYIIENEAMKASEYLTDFSLLMRLVLDNSRKSFISLEDEIKMLSTYLKLEQHRLRNKFTYRITIPRDLNLNTAIPCMFLQPFVENAIEHGISNMHENGKIIIEVMKNDSNKALEIHISDNGLGRSLSSSVAPHFKGQSIKIIQDRILLYAEKFKVNISLDIKDVEPGVGTKVVLTIPLNTY